LPGHEKLRGISACGSRRAGRAFLDYRDFRTGGSICSRGETSVFLKLLFIRNNARFAIAFADRHETSPCVARSRGQPVIVPGEMDQQWELKMFRDWPRRPHVACKISGLATQVRDRSNVAEKRVRSVLGRSSGGVGSDR